MSYTNDKPQINSTDFPPLPQKTSNQQPILPKVVLETLANSIKF